jgi:hypothetical protein
MYRSSPPTGSCLTNHLQVDKSRKYIHYLDKLFHCGLCSDIGAGFDGDLTDWSWVWLQRDLRWRLDRV